MIEAREALHNAEDPRTLSRVELLQVMLSGGVYIAPLDTAKLCGSCCALLNLVWDAEDQKDACGTAAS